jgi:hypothetical protein
MRTLQVIPADGANLYGAMVAKEIQLAKKNAGTLHRTGKKEKNRAKWAHSSYAGWINLAKAMGGMVFIEVKSKKPDAEWQLLLSVLGFLDRHFGDQIRAINIQY